MRRNTLEGLFYILLSALGYAAMPIWINYIYRFSEIQPLELFILRFGLAIPMMWLGMGLLRQFLPHLFPNEPLRRSSFLVVGLFISMASLSAFYALQNISAGVYEVLLYTFPSMVSVLAIFRGEILPPRAWVALALASTGILITSLVADGGVQTGGNPSLGVMLSLVNALSVAFFLTLTAHAQRGRASNPLSTAWAISGTGMVVLPLLFVVEPRFNYAVTVWWMLLGLSLFSTTIPLFGVLMGTQKLGASRAAIVNTIEPVFTFVMAAALLNEIPKGLQILGGIFIIGSIILMEYRSQSAVGLRDTSSRRGLGLGLKADGVKIVEHQQRVNFSPIPAVQLDASAAQFTSRPYLTENRESVAMNPSPPAGGLGVEDKLIFFSPRFEQAIELHARELLHRELTFGCVDRVSGVAPDVNLEEWDGVNLGVASPHMSLAYDPKQRRVTITDLAGTNGLFVNGEKLRPHEVRSLHSGDQLALGQLVLQVLFDKHTSS